MDAGKLLQLRQGCALPKSAPLGLQWSLNFPTTFGGWEVGRRRRDGQGSKPLLESGTRGWLPNLTTHNVFPGGPSTQYPRMQFPRGATWQLPNWLPLQSPILGGVIFVGTPYEQAASWLQCE